MNENYRESFEQAKIAGSLAAETLDEVTSYVKSGIITDRLDKICYEFIRDNGGYSAPLMHGLLLPLNNASLAFCISNSKATDSAARV